MIGVYYYPEQWPKNQWARDIGNIKALGMEHIHLAEFSWIHLQPEEKRFDFSWLDEIIEMAKRARLKIILCTPTATPPIWASKKYPEILMVKESLSRVTHGSRAHRCVNSAKFVQLSKHITTEMAIRYGDHPSIIGWQIDNEIGHYQNSNCYCSSCHAQFIDYLREKYQTIYNLNKNWGGDFWSQNYQDFDQIELPNPSSLPYLPNEHALLDFNRFFSISLSKYIQNQSKIVKKHAGDSVWVTHNFMANDPTHYPGHVDSGLDLFTLTIYPVAGLHKGEAGRQIHRIGDPYNIGLNHDKMRSYSGRWGIMEQQPGQVNWGPYNLRPYPGSTRLWLWTAIAHGAELLDTYRYRQPLSGTEQYHEGVVGLDGVELTRGGEDFVKVAKEYALLRHYFTKKRSVAEKKVALWLDWDSLTALAIHPQSEMFSPYSCLQRFYTALKKFGLQVDILYAPDQKTLKGYDIVCVVLIDLASDDFIHTLENYIELGGHVILSPRNFTRLTNGHFPERKYGYRFESLTGSVLQGYDVMAEGHEANIGIYSPGTTEPVSIIQWTSWAEQVQAPLGSDILAKHMDQFYQGSCASFSSPKGKGRISYIGFDEASGVEQLIEQCVAYTLPDTQQLPAGVLFTRQGQLGYFLNYNDYPVEIPEHLLKNSHFLIGEKETAAADLAVLYYNDKPTPTKEM